MPVMRAVLTCASAIVAMSMATGAQRVGDDVLARIDHLVYATPDLDVGVKTIEDLLGVRATAGGQHPGLGTRNALIALGPSTYLEIIGPDPQQPKPAAARRFGIDGLKTPRIIGWVAKGSELELVVSRARTAGIGLGAVIAGSRKRPDGALLSWRYTDPDVVLEHRLIPYFIDWGSSPHPASTAPRGATLVSFHAEHPEAGRVQGMLRQLGLNLAVQPGEQPALIAIIDGPKGRVELRGAA
jgi:Glyoxalase-like domain